MLAAVFKSLVLTVPRDLVTIIIPVHKQWIRGTEELKPHSEVNVSHSYETG